jgi:hypothetical protein
MAVHPVTLAAALVASALAARQPAAPPPMHVVELPRSGR